MRLHLMHASMQFGDPTPQQQSDVDKILDRAVKRNIAWLTGTEAGPGAGKLPAILKTECEERGYRFFLPSTGTDAWIAVRKDLIDGNWTQGYDQVIPGSSALYEQQGLDVKYPRWGRKGLVRVAFDNDDLGRINIGAAHYLTGSRRPGAGPVHGVDHWAWNRKLGSHIGDWAATEGEGPHNIVFYGGDQNMADNKNNMPQGDTFFGKPLTSAWDELKHWENTGHGNIDVIASYDRDLRVRAAYVRALDDSELHLNMDHFLVEAGYDVKPIAEVGNPEPEQVVHTCALCGLEHSGVLV